jgi:UDP:flavonoid glycosyltransferase YjiC (YdhE family)
VAIGLEWAGVLARRAVTIARQRVALRGLDRLAVTTSYARRAGLSHRVDPTQWLIPGLVTGLPVVVTCASELDLPSRPRPDAVFVGPMVRDDPGARVPLDGELRALLDGCRAADRPVVYCSFGTFPGSYEPSFVDRVVAAVARNPGWQLVMGRGGVDAAPPASLPDNVAVFDTVPQLEVLGAADVAVIHAGITTIHECILAGTPMVSYPVHGVTDQSGNAVRIAHHGLASVGDRVEPVDVVERRIAGALADDGARRRVERFGDDVAAYRRDGAVEAAVDRLLAAQAQ